MNNGLHMLKVGDFVLNTDSRKLYNKEKKEVALPPTLFTLLKFFIDHQNQVCSKDMIIDNVWKGKIVVEANVNQNIKKLRDVLGDSANDPKYIETVTGEGFRFIANSEAYRAAPLIVEKKLNNHKFILAFIAVLIVIYLAINIGKKNDNSLVKELHPLTSLRGLEHYPFVSSDKKYLLFSHRLEGSWDIYLKPMNKESYHTIISSEENERFPILSEDRKKLIYFLEGNGRCGLYVRSIVLESSQVGDENLLRPCQSLVERIKAEWINENEIFISVNEDPKSPASIYQFDLITKNQKLISKPDLKGFGDYSMKYSDKFKKLAYIRDIGWSFSEIWVYDLKNFTHKKIKASSLILRGLDWTDDGWIIFQSTNKEISKINPDSLNEEVLARFSEKIYLPFAIDNNRLGAVVGEYQVIDIGVFDLNKRTHTTAISSSANDYLAAGGDDFITFVSNRSGDPQVWINYDTNDFVQLTHFTNSMEISGLSVFPGKDLIIFNKSGSINIIDKFGKNIFDSADYSNHVHRNPVFDPRNNNFIYAVQYDGEWNIESRKISSLADRHLLFKGISARPCIVEDCLFYIKDKDPSLYKYMLNSNTSYKVAEIGLVAEVHEWDVVDDENIVFIKKGEELNQVINLNIITNQESLILETKAKKFSLDKLKNRIFTNIVSQGNIDLMYFNLQQ